MFIIPTTKVIAPAKINSFTVVYKCCLVSCLVFPAKTSPTSTIFNPFFPPISILNSGLYNIPYWYLRKYLRNFFGVCEQLKISPTAFVNSFVVDVPVLTLRVYSYRYVK